MKNQITTFSGKLFDVLDPNPDDINIHDIAFGLSRQFRFNGVTRHPYTVAQHSINVARITGDGMKLAALLHDASEAYLHDLPTPLKQNLPDYQRIEKKLQDTIYAVFGIDQHSVESGVNWADKQVLLSEIDTVVMHPNLFGRKAGKSLWNITSRLDLQPMGIEESRQHFLTEFMLAIEI